MEVLKRLYFDLMRCGWTLTDIDEMDIHWYLAVMEHALKRPEPKAYIDQIPGL